MTHLSSIPLRLFLRSGFFLFVMFAINQPVYAQADQRWFQIEVIAFARQQADQQEYWPHNIKLSYPLRWVALTSAEAPATENEGIQTSELPDITTQPFYALPANERRLSRQAAALNRDHRYRVLFHQAWRQPLGATRNAPAVLIAGGNTYGEHSELEGSIIFGLGQLAEVKAQLWLTEFEHNQGQAFGDWPLLPRSPLQLQQELTRSQELPEPIAFGEPQNPGLEFPDSNDTYIPKRIVLLEEDRRLRSNEIHYLDHPLLGVIVQLTPYELPR